MICIRISKSTQRLVKQRVAECENKSLKSSKWVETLVSRVQEKQSGHIAPQGQLLKLICPVKW